MTRVISLDEIARRKGLDRPFAQAERAPRPELIFTYYVLASFAVLGETTTYGELYDILAARFGWRKRWNGNGWVRSLPLAELGTLNRENGEPALAALVRKKDGTIGVGYKTAHLHCHDVALTGHEGGCECEVCRNAVNEASPIETRRCFEHFSWAKSDA